MMDWQGTPAEPSYDSDSRGRTESVFSQRMKTRLPDNETVRLATLVDYGILDTPPEIGFDDLTPLAAILGGAPLRWSAC
jgi:hypothetical protein